MLQIDLIIFDLDGTLLDTPPNIAWSINTTLKHFGLKTLPNKKIYRHIGIGVEHLIISCLGQKNKKFFEQAMHFFKNHQRQNYYKKVKVYPGVREILEHFKNKIKIVVSNKNYFLTRLSLEHFGLEKYFKKIYGGDAPHLRKPSSYKIIKILNEFHVKPEKAVIVGDLPIDIETGKNSGVHTIAVTYGLGTYKDLKKARPEFIISKIKEIKKIIF